MEKEWKMRCVPHGVAENMFRHFTFLPVDVLSETHIPRLWTCPVAVDKDRFPPPGASGQSGSSPQIGVDNLFPTPTPFSTENAVFLSTATAFAPQGSGCHPLFGHGQDIPQIVHGLSTAFFTGAGRLTAGKCPDRQGFSVFPQYPAPLLLLLLKDIRIDR